MGLKAVLRRRVPPRYWALARRVARSGGRRCEAAVAGTVAQLLKAFTDGTSIDLREKLILERPLDYRRAGIMLRVTSRQEKDLRLRSCAKEPETVAWIEHTLHAGDVLYDVGANVGAYALVAAQWTRGRATIYAFEPGYATFPNLVANVFLNRCEDAVIPLAVALGAETALAQFGYATLEAGGANHGGISPRQASTPAVRMQTVPTYRLDDLVEWLHLKPPSHLKIDVDGAELSVLSGTVRLLTSPTLRWIMVEVDGAGRQAQAIETLLATHGFSLEGDHPHAGGVTHNRLFRRTGLPAGPDQGGSVLPRPSDPER